MTSRAPALVPLSALLVAAATWLPSCKTTTQVFRPAAEADDDGPTGSRELDAGTDADPGPCPGSYLLSSGSCAMPLGKVTRAPLTLTPLRDHHTTSVVETKAGPFIYLIGGTEAFRIIYDDVLRAPIQPDGSLGPFVKVAKLPEERAGHCSVFHGGRLYLLGGTPDFTTQVAKVNDDGSLGPFTAGPPMNLGLHHMQCELVGDSIYMLGGRGEDGQSRAIAQRTRIAADGSLTPFTPLTELPESRSHHESIVHGGRIYLLGGLTGDPAKDPLYRDDVISADIAADGTLGAWQPRGRMPFKLSVSATQAFEEAVYLLGGLHWDDGESDQILRVNFAPDGALTYTTLDVRLSVSRGHVHQTPVWKNHIYSMGGKLDVDHSTGIVDIGEFTPAPARR